jgi:class 3 adenylate cyclase
VLVADQLGRAVADAIRARNPGALVTDRGAYLRVSCPDQCTLSASDVEASTGAPFSLPLDLERVMPSFSGYLSLDGGVARWTRAKARP